LTPSRGIAREPRAGLLGRTDECAVLDGLVADARVGQSRVLVLRGEAGIGKTALLDYLEANADGCRVAGCAGVESEMEMAYAGLHQLCAPFLDRVDRLPAPQRGALGIAFGLTTGEVPDRFLVGLAVLNLLAELAEQQPLLCVVDDAQWLDRVSVQTLAFVARRLLAERIAIVIAVREPLGEADLDGLPALVILGLSDADAGDLLDSVIRGRVDQRVSDRIVAETRGNPLALLELPRAWTTAELVDGFEQPGAMPLSGRIEQSFRRRLRALEPEVRQLLLIAAAEPLGDVTLMWRAAGALGLGEDSATGAQAAGLIEFGARVRFRHPLVRAAVYREASVAERQIVHRALASVTDSHDDPDRRAWHRAHSSPAPDEEVAIELVRSAGRAQARGGLVASAAFLERAASLTPDPVTRAQRELAAAWVKRDAGLLESALALAAAAEAGPSDALRAAEVEHLRGQIAFDQRRDGDAARLLLDAASKLQELDPDLSREAYLDALAAAIWASGPEAPDGVLRAARAARAGPPARQAPRPVDLILDALVSRFIDGYVVAAPLLNQALASLRVVDVAAADTGRVLSLGGNRVSSIIATEVWDFDAGRALAERQVQLARDKGALLQLQFALNVLASNELLAGDLASAAAHIEEDRLVAETTGNPPVAYAALLLAAYRGQEQAASSLITAARDQARVLGHRRIGTFADYASAVLHNGVGRHDLARDDARRVFEYDVIGGYQVQAIAELAEAASRTGDDALLAAALTRMSERTPVNPTGWVLGIEARLQALASDGDEADERYRTSAELLASTGLRTEAARGHLLYGEWLRRVGRRVDARRELRIAFDSLAAIGLAAFAERARRELMATGERVRKRSVIDAGDELTVQEFQIASLAREGLSNPEIGTRLFLSPRTVEWHMRKVFGKLGVSSRRQLRDAVLDVAAS
jgi:DNA-binding CsgD family transcriptional regulator